MEFLAKTLPIFAAIFITVLVLILLTRITVLILFHFAKKKYQQLKSKRLKTSNSEPLKKDFLPKEDEARFIQKAPPVQQYEKLPAQISQEEEYDLNETKIVDIVQPVGFWTSMVLGSKMTYLISSAKLMNQNSKKGFWTSMIEAEARAQGRQRGRSRY